MKKLKNIIIPTSFVIISIIAFLFIVQSIDNALNKKTYAQIDYFYTQTNQVENKDKCLEQYDYILHNAQSGSSDVQIYDKALKACNQYKKDTNNLDVPKNIPADRIAELKNYKKLNSLFIDTNIIRDINTFKTCKGNADCMANKNQELYLENKKAEKIIIERAIAMIDSQRRLSFKYYYKLYPIKLKEKRSLARVNKVIADYGNY